MHYSNFGKTWWGEKWLNAFAGITYENRLPRGRAYARRGSVLKIDIKGNKITAKVQGSRSKPYEIKIIIPEFSGKVKTAILDIIKGNNFYLSSLLTRKMPSELYEALSSKKIHLFPRSWKDVDAQCSCPDWAVPCKHIAAVIYIIANEIDKNPFLIFSLHNFDILNELKSSGIDVQKSDRANIKSADEILQKTRKIDGVIVNSNYKEFDKLDFSEIPNLRDQLLSLLSDNPLFYDGKDFKIILGKFYKNIAATGNWLEVIGGEKKYFFESCEIYLKTDNNLDLAATLRDISPIEKKILTSKLSDILDFLNRLTPSEIQRCSEKIIACYYIFHFTIKLIEQSTFIPQLIKISEQEYKIRWVPALLNDKVALVFKNLAKIIPFDLVEVEDFEKIKKQKDKKYLDKEDQVLIVISGIIDYFAEKCFAENIAVDYNDGIVAFFFAPKNLIINKFETAELPQTISLWLGGFYLGRNDYAPLLKIEESRERFSIEAMLENVKNQMEEPIPFKEIFSNQKYSKIKTDALKDLTLLAEHFKEIEKVISSAGREKIVFSSKQFAAVFFSILPVIKLLGVKLLLPKGLDNIIKPTLSLKINKKSDSVKSYLSFSEMLNFEWRIALGDNILPVDEFFKLVKNTNGIVKIKDQFIYIGKDEIDKILKHSSEKPKPDYSQIGEALFAQSYRGAKIELSQEVINLINSLAEVKEISRPKDIKADLRPYQERGFNWLYKNAKINFGSLIADDMGLGKTVQVISALLKFKEEKIIGKRPGLVVAPTTLLSNWEKEVKKFAPSLKTFIFHGQQRKLKEENIDLIITSYGLIKRDLEKFKNKKWPFLVIDEAQNIKNPDTKQTQAVKSLQSDIRIAMSGTPVENRLSEYWSILDFLNHGCLGNLNYFKREYGKPIEIDRDHKKLEIFKKITAPFILRRVKTDKSIISDLPDKIEADQIANLTPEQASLYQNILDETMKQIENSEGIERKGLVFKLMTALKQICNHPAHYLKKKEANPEISGKTDLLLEILGNIDESGGKALIFTQYTKMGELLVKILQNRFGSPPLFLHGSLSRTKRDEIVECFQTKKQPAFMILSLKAGGTGLNLTAAANVIHYDLWWNPAVEAQATDRAFRIGQTKNVMVHRFITKGTFEEKIDKMIKDKRELANLAVSGGEHWIGELSNKEIKDIFKLEKD